VCPPELTAPVPPEPRAPKGISASALESLLASEFGAAGSDLFEWIAVDEPGWGRDLQRRLNAVAAAKICK
jgi:hypothetical protein